MLLLAANLRAEHMWTAPHDLLHKAEAMTMDAEQNALLDIQSMMYPKLSSNEMS